jgi:hypothetical protein
MAPAARRGVLLSILFILTLFHVDVNPFFKSYRKFTINKNVNFVSVYRKIGVDFSFARTL